MLKTKNSSSVTILATKLTERMIDKTHEVATAFLMRKGKILLLRRSPKVGTYKGKWGAVSGYVEAYEKPLETALKEINEETGLTLKEIRLVRQGRIEAKDEELEIRWTINTFLFECSSTRIKLNWENKEARWVEPKEIGKLETVPKLKEALDELLKKKG